METSGLLESLARTGDGVFAVDEEQRIIIWNRGAEAILGYSPAEATGKCCVEIIQGLAEAGGVDCTHDCTTLNRGLGGEVVCGRNIRAKTKNGLWRWLSMTHAFLSLENGRLAGVHIFRDVTPEVEAKRLLGQIRAQLACHELPEESGEDANGQETGLTGREKQVLELLSQGEGTTSIAKKLTISNTTARNHIQNILGKMGVHTRLEAVAFALRHGIIDPV